MQNSSILTGWFDKDDSCKDNLIANWLMEHEQEMIDAADYIFQNPELAYKETLAAKCLSNFLAHNGFKIEEVPVKMRLREFGESMHGGILKPIKYMINILYTICIIILRNVFRRRGIK